MPELKWTRAAKGDGSAQRKNPSSEAMKAFSAEYKKRHKEAPEVYSATMADMLHLLAEGFAANTDTDGVRKYLLAVKNYPGASGETTFLPNRDVDKPVELKIIKAGKYESYKP